MTSRPLKRKPSSSSLLSSKASKLTLGPVPKAAKSLKPLNSLGKLPSATQDTKGKGKEVIVIDDDDPPSNGGRKGQTQDDSSDERMWVDLFEPQTETELAVHKRKVEDIRRWLREAFEGGPSGKLKKYRKILVLSGPAGSGKTTTLRVLAREFGAEILEWNNAMDDVPIGDAYERETLHDKFEGFLSRASTCLPLLPSQVAGSSKTPAAHQLVLLEELPNVLHQGTRIAFHDLLNSYATSHTTQPMVIIISDAVTRGEVRDELLTQGGYRGSAGVIDVRTVLPASLINGPYVTQISFNPIAPTLMKRALQSLIDKLSSHSTSAQKARKPANDLLDVIVESSQGDIRSAVMSLQFSAAGHVGESVRSGRGTKKTSVRTVKLLEALTRREQSLALFHLLGKVLYNKRKGDPPSQSATARDKLCTEQIDAKLLNPPPLPDWLSRHDRKASRIDVDSLYADSPVDTGLYSLYIHQNYAQFCDTLDQCGSLMDWLSWTDASGGEQWHQTNPHQFHLVTLGALHSLPSPVPRRSQKMYKPDYFDSLQKTKEGQDGAEDVLNWISGLQSQASSNVNHDRPLSFWSKSIITQEMGALLTAIESSGGVLPQTHRSFSVLQFSPGLLHSDPMADDEGPPSIVELEPDVQGVRVQNDSQPDIGNWLDTDDIENF